MFEFKSLRQLTEELTEVRLGAANSSLWSIGTTLSERARNAVNEALDSYPIRYPAMYHSATLHTGAPIVLPSNVESVIELRSWTQSNSPVTKIPDIRHVPSLTTNLLYVNRLPRPTLEGEGVEMEVMVNVYDLPADVALNAPIGAYTEALVVTGNAVVGVWPQIGYIELTPPAHINTSVREVVKYDGISSGVFTNVVRGVAGEARAWTTGTVVSAVVPCVQGMDTVIQKAAKANMYQFWVAHRAQYDRYVANSGLQEVDMPTLLTLIRTLQDEADRRYARVMKKVPRVGFVRRKGRR